METSEHSYSSSERLAGTFLPRRRLLRVFLSLALVLSTSLGVLPRVAALQYPVTIAIDGVFADWASVLADSENSTTDPVGASDADGPSAEADLAQVASTWDASNLYAFARINTQVKARLDYRVYVDTDGDGLMSSTDKVVVLSFNPQAKFTGGGVASYSPAAGGGDPLGGSGSTPPGTVGGTVAVANLTASNITSARTEVRIPWAGLGVAAGSPVRVQVAVRVAGNANWDNAGVLSMRYYGVTFTPNRTAAGQLGTTVQYLHTLSNTGNGTERFNLSATSTLGWPTVIKDSVTGDVIPNVLLAAGGSREILVEVSIPLGATPGAKDVATIRATCAARATVFATVVDSTYAGPVVVGPDRAGSMAEGGTIQYAHTVTNASSDPQNVSLAALSNSGWIAGVYNAGGAPIASLSLAAGASVPVFVRVVVPGGTLAGTVDTTTLRVALQAEPAVFDEAVDITTVRLPLTIEPDRVSVGSEGKTVFYAHTVTNSWTTTRTIALSATSSLGWPVAVLDSDGVTPLSSVSVGPYGAARNILVRLSIPASVPLGAEDLTTVRATFAPASLVATATDRTQVSNLITYSGPALITPKTEFIQGDTVWAHGTTLSPYAAVRFRWLDPSGNTVFTSAPVPVNETDFDAASSYTIPSNAAVGTWNVVLLNAANGAEISRTPFTVLLNQWVSLTVSDTLIEFGQLDPGTPSPQRTVLVSVDSNIPFTVTRTMTGDVAAMGLSVTGPAPGLKAPGPAAFSELFQATVPWTTAPGSSLSVVVNYSVIF